MSSSKLSMLLLSLASSGLDLRADFLMGETFSMCSQVGTSSSVIVVVVVLDDGIWVLGFLVEMFSMRSRVGMSSSKMVVCLDGEGIVD